MAPDSRTWSHAECLTANLAPSLPARHVEKVKTRECTCSDGGWAVHRTISNVRAKMDGLDCVGDCRKHHHKSLGWIKFLGSWSTFLNLSFLLTLLCSFDYGLCLLFFLVCSFIKEMFINNWSLLKQRCMHPHKIIVIIQTDQVHIRYVPIQIYSIRKTYWTG